jgi:hypothetical protein
MGKWRDQYYFGCYYTRPAIAGVDEIVDVEGAEDSHRTDFWLRVIVST